MSSRTWAGVVLGVLLVFLLPERLLAWGPATHLHLGLEVLGSLDLLPGPMARLLAGQAMEFLYGSLAADIPLGKSYAPTERHPHSWQVGRELRDRAGDDPALQAFAVGYLSHLAADVAAHERFVPRMLLLTSSTRSLGHSYWEHRMDASVAPEKARMARSLVLDHDHGRLDEHLDEILDRLIFSFDTNRRIFRGMVRIADDERWQNLFDTLLDNSRWDLRQRETDLFVRESFDLVADYLRRPDASRAEKGDPTGREALDRAKNIRRQVLLVERWNAPEALVQAADRFFPLPEPEEELWERRGGTGRIGRAVRARLSSSTRRQAAAS